jgi:ATP-binding cassette subfamily F protein 3
LKKIGWEEEEEAPQNRPKEKPSRQEVKRLRSELIIERGRELGPLKKRMENLEKTIYSLEEEQQKLEQEMIELATQSDSKKIQQCSQRLGVIKKSIEESFEELTEMTIKHDDIFARFEDKLKDLEV